MTILTKQREGIAPEVVQNFMRFLSIETSQKLPLRAVRRAANLIWHSCRWQLCHKKWSWLASARLRRGVFSESSWKLRTALASNAPLPPPLARRSPFPGGEGWRKSFLRGAVRATGCRSALWRTAADSQGHPPSCSLPWKYGSQAPARTFPGRFSGFWPSDSSLP